MLRIENRASDSSVWEETVFSKNGASTTGHFYRFRYSFWTQSIRYLTNVRGKMPVTHGLAEVSFLLL